MKEMLYEVQCLKSNEDMIISNTVLHITFLSYDIPFTGKHCMKEMLYEVRCLKSYEDMIISKTALHITFLLHDIPFTGKHEPNKLTCSQLRDFVAKLLRALHRHRTGHGFESR